MRFAGDIDDLPAALSLADVVVLPATRPDPSGVLAAAAQAMGRPVIVTNQGALAGERDAGGHRLAGAAGRSRRARAWPWHLALAMDDGVRRRLAARARAFVVDEFGMERMCERTLAVYRELVEPAEASSRRAGCALGLTAGASPPSRSCAVPHLPNGKAISSPRPGSGPMNLSASAPVDVRASAPIAVTFPDGTTRSFPRGVTGAEIAAAIAKSLAKAALVGRGRW